MASSNSTAYKTDKTPKATRGLWMAASKNTSFRMRSLVAESKKTWAKFILPIGGALMLTNRHSVPEFIEVGDISPEDRAYMTDNHPEFVLAGSSSCAASYAVPHAPLATEVTKPKAKRSHDEFDVDSGDVMVGNGKGKGKADAPVMQVLAPRKRSCVEESDAEMEDME